MSLSFKEFNELEKDTVVDLGMNPQIDILDVITFNKYNAKVELYQAKNGFLKYCVVFDQPEDIVAYTLAHGKLK